MRVWRLGLVALVVFVAAPVVGQDSAGTAENDGSGGEAREAAVATPEDLVAARVARERFREGMADFQARRFREAIHAFQLAAQAVPSADLWFNIARAYEELNDATALGEAVDHYRMYLRDRVDPPDREAVEQRIALLEERIEAARQATLSVPTTGTLRVDGSVEGASVTLDDQPAGQTPIAAPLALAPGTHALELSREGFVPFRAEVAVLPGAVTAAYARLSPTTEYRSERGRRVWTWVLAGLSVAGLGASVALGVRARSEARMDLGEGRRWATFSDYALGGAITFGLAAFVVALFEGRSLRTVLDAAE